MPYSKIIGTGSYLPEKILTNQDLEKLVDTTDEWIMKRVGIKERHIVADSGDTTSSMAIAAAKKALETAGIEDPNQIDLIVVGTASSDYYFPSVACLIQNALGINNECAAMDVNAACAGFVYGLSVADQYIRSGEAKTALIVGVDTLSSVLDWSDRSTCVLFGDGAGAVVIQASDEPGIVATQLKAAGKYGKLLFANSHLFPGKTNDYGIMHMEGHDVFKLAVMKLGQIVDDVLSKVGYDRSQIDWLVPHQANLRIIKATAKKLNLPMEHVVLTVDRHGNTSAASIPLAFDAAVRDGKIQRGETVLMEAFGAGLSWGAVLLNY